MVTSFRIHSKPILKPVKNEPRVEKLAIKPEQILSPDNSPQNVYMYWIGPEYKLISVLRNIVYLHSTNGRGYNVILINEKNINDYVKNIPEYFSTLCPAHQADFVRVNVICDYGGIWLDSDTLVMDSLDCLFDLINNNGFFIKENNAILWNGIFGSKKETPLMIKWKARMREILDIKNGKITWCEIGNELLQSLYKNEPSLYTGYTIFNGLDNLYPVNWNNCVKEFITAPFDNYKNIIRDFQPLIVLVNSVYKYLEPRKNILEEKIPLNYFIEKSIENMKLINYDFIEIGTSNFDTLIQNASKYTIGLSVDAVKYYIDCLPDKPNVKKINVAISDKTGQLNVYYIPENIIKKEKLYDWFKGCNCINNYHPLHIKHNVTHLCVIDTVAVITAPELFYKNKARSVKFLKIDTEGHDCVILKSLFDYIKTLPDQFHPLKIQFESNEHTNPANVTEIIDLYCSIGYNLIQRGYDTVMCKK